MAPEVSTRSYHLVAKGGDRDIKADHVNVTAGGALIFSRGDGEQVCAYAPGEWLYVEIERLDDSGGSEAPVAAKAAVAKNADTKK